MLYVILCTDKPGHEQVRLDNRAAHLDYLRGYGDQLFAAGPTLSEDGARMTGSLLVLDFPDRASVDTFTANDPYARAGLFAEVLVRPWKKVIPAN